MEHPTVREAFVPRPLTTGAVIAALAAAVAVYQATSLLLGPAGDRQIALSLSLPSGFEELPLPALPAAQVLQVGRAVADRMEWDLASLPSVARPQGQAGAQVAAGAAVRAIPPGPAGAPAAIPVAGTPAPPTVGLAPAGGHARPDVLAGKPRAMRPAASDPLGWPA